MCGNGGNWEKELHALDRECMGEICSPALPDLNQPSEFNYFASWPHALSLRY